MTPPYSRSPKVGNPIASILKSNGKGIPALFDLNPVSNFLGLTIEGIRKGGCLCRWVPFLRVLYWLVKGFYDIGASIGKAWSTSY